MTVFGDVDVSTLTELPAGRSPVVTHVVVPPEQPSHLARVWERVREEVLQGHRVFVVCPRIGAEDTEGEDVDSWDADGDKQPLSTAAAVIPTAARLQSGELDGVRVGVLHGRMSGEEKDDIKIGRAHV